MRSLTAFSALLLGVPFAVFLIAVWLTGGAPFASPANLDLQRPPAVGGVTPHGPHAGAAVDAAELDWLKSNAMVGAREAQMPLGHFAGEAPGERGEAATP